MTLPPTPSFLPQTEPAVSPVPLAYASLPAQQYKLFSPAGVGLATFLGSPIAGSILLSRNYRRLGRSSSANKAILLGALATAAIFVLAMFLPSGFPGIIIGIAAIAAMVQLAKTLQGKEFERHSQSGGKVGSMWTATGIGLASGVVVFGLFAGIAYGAFYLKSPLSGPRWTVGNATIYYSGASTQSEAKALESALRGLGVFSSGRPVSVILNKSASGADTTLGFVVNKDAGTKDGMLDAFTQITNSVAPAIGGKPITLKLLDSNLTEINSKKIP